MGTRSFEGLLFCLLCSIAVHAQQYAVVDRIPFSGDQTYWDYLTSDGSSSTPICNARQRSADPGP